MQFASALGLQQPILLAPMAGACPPALSIAVAKAGGMGACGALLMTPAEIADWCAAFRAAGVSAFQLNVWTPDPVRPRNAAHEAQLRAFLGQWGPAIADGAGDARPPDFGAQCEAMLAARPTAISSIMGLFGADFIARMKAAGILWFATATTLDEARAAADAGADAIIAQGFEAGGHRGAFDPALAERNAVGTFALVPAIADAVDLPVIAAGGIADGRGVAAALALGASAAMIGTAFLRAPEAGLPAAWAARLSQTAPEATMITRAFSGRPGRAIANDYARAASAIEAAPYPVQRGLTAAMRADAVRNNDIERMQAWAGQSAALAEPRPAGEIVAGIWRAARAILA